MPVPPADGALAAPLRRAAVFRVSRWRLPAIETYPRFVAFAQTWAGRSVLCGLFLCLLRVDAVGMAIEQNGMWLQVALAAALVAFSGRYRHPVLLLSTGFFLAHAPDWFDYHAVHSAASLESASVDFWYLRAATLIACAALAALVIHLARRWRDLPIARQPVLLAHFLLCGLLALAASHALRGVPQVALWSVIVVFVTYFWFLAYSLIDQRRSQPATILEHFSTFNPFYWLALTPIGKGYSQWRKVEADGAHDLAVTQLKALKLLAWAFVLKVVLWAFRWAVHGKLGVPTLQEAFETFASSGTAPPLGFASIVANFPEQMLMLAVWGHVLVGIGRFAGFQLLRNTCRPLSARSIAEFWNRYYYYFKELLADVYFYPTYVRCFKRHPRLRIAFATFMAAGVGNFFFHFTMRERDTIVYFGLFGALSQFQTYAFYCVLLSAGIIVSQLRARTGGAARGWWRGHALPSFGVAMFFCFLSFFDSPLPHMSVAGHFRFLLQVIGLQR